MYRTSMLVCGLYYHKGMNYSKETCNQSFNKNIAVAKSGRKIMLRTIKTLNNLIKCLATMNCIFSEPYKVQETF